MFAKRIDQIQPFRVMEILARAASYEEQGLKVVHFEVGEPDFATAAPIVEAGQRALQQGQTKYTQAGGIPQLRDAIVGHYAGMDVQLEPERIIVTSGASGGLTLLAALLLDPGDELLITDPGYPCNEVFARLTGASPRTLPVFPEQRFQPSPQDLVAAWSALTKGVLLASPANPTGTMLPRQWLTEIAQFAQEQQGFLILDEIYQGITSQAEYQSGLQVAPDIFVLNSFSKFFGMTGWRLGWIVVPENAIEATTKLAQNLFIAPNTPAQYAALAAFGEGAMAIHRQRAATFAQRASLLSSGLRELGFHIPVQPDGAFYLFVDIAHTGMQASVFTQRLLDEFQVAVTPGADFGDHLPNYVRFAYTTDEASIELGLERIAAALRAWGI